MRSPRPRHQLESTCRMTNFKGSVLTKIVQVMMRFTHTVLEAPTGRRMKHEESSYDAARASMREQEKWCVGRLGCKK